MKTKMKILTNDPSFTGWGYAVVQIDPKQMPRIKVLESGCIKTQPEHKKRRIRKSDDLVRRLIEVCQQLKQIISKHGIDYILSEAPHGSQNASAAVMIGAVAGLVAGIGTMQELPVEWYSEQDAKKFLSGKNSLTKKRTIQLISEYYTVEWTGTKYKDEAIADAIAVFHVALGQSPTIQYLTQQFMQPKKGMMRTK